MHRSELVGAPMQIVYRGADLTGLNNTRQVVQLLQLDFYQDVRQIEHKEALYSKLESIIENSDTGSISVILCSPAFAVDFSSSIKENIYLKLWVAIKLKDPIPRDGNLTMHHASLLVFTKSNSQLVHTKTRIGYAYCESCDKTVKDYGGKKHLYNSFGTLMSDVWRDITYDQSNEPTEILERVRDLFSTGKFSSLDYFDLRRNDVMSLPKYESTVTRSKRIKQLPVKSQLLLGDSIDQLKKLPDNSIDFAFSDPPYNLKKKYESWNDGLDIQQYFSWCDEWIAELARVVKPGHAVAILNIPQWCVRHFKSAKNILQFQDWIAWEGLSLPVRMIMPAHYGILVLSKGSPRELPGLKRTLNESESKNLYSIGDNFCVRPACSKNRKKEKINDSQFVTNLWWDVHRLKHNSKRVDHPCQLPPLFMYRLISLFTNEGEVVLDNFDGSGTTSLCAHQMNRNYIGIELSEYYYGISAQRHLDIENGIDPFRKNNDEVKAKNSYVARLKKQKYEVPKKVLQMDVKRISEILGHIPSKEEVQLHSTYPIEYFTNYFINWAEVTAAARTTGMTEDKVIL